MLLSLQRERVLLSGMPPKARLSQSGCNGEVLHINGRVLSCTRLWLEGRIQRFMAQYDTHRVLWFSQLSRCMDRLSIVQSMQQVN